MVICLWQAPIRNHGVGRHNSKVPDKCLQGVVVGTHPLSDQLVPIGVSVFGFRSLLAEKYIVRLVKALVSSTTASVEEVSQLFRKCKIRRGNRGRRQQTSTWVRSGITVLTIQWTYKKTIPANNPNSLFWIHGLGLLLRATVESLDTHGNENE